jgi:hypothetical protein
VLLTMSQRERDRLVVVRQVAEGKLTVAEGARRLGLGVRQMRRCVRAYERVGDASVIHGLRERPSNRRLSEVLRDKALEKARLPMYRDFGPTLLSEHLDRDPNVGFVHASTLRLWMVEAELWKPRERRSKHRKRRERRAAAGEMVLIDTSIHDWLEGRGEEEMVLIALIDDATSHLYCRFFPRDNGVANRQLLVEYIERHGRMGAVYADRAGHFKVNFRAKERREKELSEALTLIRRALESLDIELIIALSPQAKGRVERLFKTLQDRLIKEMRVAGIATMDQANCFLDEVFIPFWDERFGVEPREKVDVYRALPEGIDLLRTFAETEERVLRADFTFRYKNRFYQIEAHEADGAMPKSRVTIEERLDGTTRFRWHERYLLPTPLLGAPTKPEQQKTAPAPPPACQPPSGRPGRPPPADHPWRLFPIVVGKGRSLTSPASRATLPTPQPEEILRT